MRSNHARDQTMALVDGSGNDTTGASAVGGRRMKKLEMIVTTIEPGDVIAEIDVLSAIDSHQDSSHHDDDDDAPLDDDCCSRATTSTTTTLTWMRSIDAILLLGGGVPLSPDEPPEYVQRRCDVVARIVDMRMRDEEKEKEMGMGRGDGDFGNDGGNDDGDDATLLLPPISVVCLSAGTAHLPQYIASDGLPLWESTASASYLLSHPEYPIPAERVFVETSSYDTISNAFFARTSFADVVNAGEGGAGGEGGEERKRKKKSWTRILVVTSEFHVGRTRAIFDWVFGAPISSSSSSSSSTTTPIGYELYYLSCDDAGHLSREALDARRAHESRGEANVREHLSGRYPTLRDVWRFLVTKHDFYSAGGLVRRSSTTATTMMDDGRRREEGWGGDEMLKLSYGKTATTAAAAKAKAAPSMMKEDDGGDGGGGMEKKRTKKMLEYANGKIKLRIDAAVPLVVAATALSALAVTVVVVVVGGRMNRR